MNRRDSRPPSNRPRVKAAASPGERLQKVLAAHGLGSRREIDAWVAAGRVSVDGTVAMPGTRVSGSERIRIDGQLVRLGARSRVARVLRYHKPVGQVVIHSGLAIPVIHRYPLARVPSGSFVHLRSAW